MDVPPGDGRWGVKKRKTIWQMSEERARKRIPYSLVRLIQERDLDEAIADIRWIYQIAYYAGWTAAKRDAKKKGGGA